VHLRLWRFLLADRICVPDRSDDRRRGLFGVRDFSRAGFARPAGLDVRSLFRQCPFLAGNLRSRKRRSDRVVARKPKSSAERPRASVVFNVRYGTAFLLRLSGCVCVGDRARLGMDDASAFF